MVGGNSLLNGFTDRLNRDLSSKTPPVSLTHSNPFFSYFVSNLHRLEHTVNVEIFAQCIFSRISRTALDARKYDVSEKINQNSTNRTYCLLRKKLVTQKRLLRLDARKFSCAKISTFTVVLVERVPVTHFGTQMWI